MATVVAKERPIAYEEEKVCFRCEAPTKFWGSAPTTPYVVDSTRAGIPTILRRFKKGDTVK
jgi:hypothetical protein